MNPTSPEQHTIGHPGPSTANHHPAPAPGHPHDDGAVSAVAARGTGLRVGLIAVVVVLGLAATFAYGLLFRKQNRADLEAATRLSAEVPLPVEVVRVHRASTDRLVALPGEARALYETTLYARTSGYLKNWAVDIGDRVKQGQVLATIETPELDDQLIAAQAKVAQAKAEADLADASAKFADVSYHRWELAAPEGAVSAQDRDQKKAELDTARAKLEAAKASVNLADADVKRLQTLVGFKSVTAPFDGTVTQRHVDFGDLVTAGSTSSTTPLFTIARSDQIRVFVDVPQRVSPEIVVGMRASAAVDEFPDRPFEGKVSRTADSIDPVSRTLRVEVLVPNAELALKPGMFAQVTFKSDRRNPPLRIPASALTLRPSGPQVAVVSADGTVKMKAIKIRHDLGDFIEVSSGLEDGQSVALNLSSDVADGERVTAHLVPDDEGQVAGPATKPATPPQKDAERNRMTPPHRAITASAEVPGR